MVRVHSQPDASWGFSGFAFHLKTSVEEKIKWNPVTTAGCLPTADLAPV